MRALALAAISILILTSSIVFSQEVGQNQETEVEDMNTCNGTWILNYQGTWSATRTEDGISINIPPTATILDCGGREGTLKDNIHNKVKATVRCTHSQNGVTHASKVQIICE
jgi:hypothetical protein